MVYQCPHCIFCHPDQGYVTGKGHPEKFHGNKQRPNIADARRRLLVVSRAEGRRLAEFLRQWQQGERRAGRPDTPYDKDGNPRPGARALPTAPPNPQGLLNAATNVNANVNAANANTNALNAMAMVPQGRETVVLYQCYYCFTRGNSREYIRQHCTTQHPRELVQDPFQPGRVANYECDKETLQPIKLVATGPPQRPHLSHVAEEVRELILRQLLQVPTDYLSGKAPVDKNIFMAFSLNSAIRAEALHVFAKWNFLIRIVVSGFDLPVVDGIEDLVSENLSVLPDGVARQLGRPALTVRLDLEPPAILATKRRVQRTIALTIVYNQRSFIQLCSILQHNLLQVRTMQVEFAEFANDLRYGSAKSLIVHYLGYLRGVKHLLFYDGHTLVKDLTTYRMCAIRDLEEEVLRDWRELVTFLQEQLRRRMFNEAKMTLLFLNTVTQILDVRAEPTLGSFEGTERSRIVQNVKRECFVAYAVGAMECSALKESSRPHADLTSLDAIDKAFSEVAKKFTHMSDYQEFSRQFPGIPDRLRARAHLARAVTYSRLARSFLRLHESTSWKLATSHEFFFEVTEDATAHQLWLQDVLREQIRDRERPFQGLAPFGFAVDAQDIFRRFPDSTMVEMATLAIHEFCFANFLHRELNEADNNTLKEQLDQLLADFHHVLTAKEISNFIPEHVRYGSGFQLAFEWAGDPTLVQIWHEMSWGDERTTVFDRMLEFQKRPEGWDEGEVEILARTRLMLDDIQVRMSSC